MNASRSKNFGKTQEPTHAGALPYRLVHSVLGLTLIAAGVLKLYELAFETQDEGAATLLLMAFSEAEVLGGIWMLVGAHPARTHLWAIVGFSGLAASSLLQALAGKCSCGCFGSLSVSPWVALVLDLAAVAVLLNSRPQADPKKTSLTRPQQYLVLGTVALYAGFVGWKQADLITLSGKATTGGHPLAETDLTFTGVSGKIVLHTNRDGNFRLPLVRPGLYAVSGPGRVNASRLRPEQARPKPVKGTAQRSRQRPALPDPRSEVGTIIWVQISECSENDKLLEFPLTN